jgi:hypothetical protein
VTDAKNENCKCINLLGSANLSYDIIRARLHINSQYNSEFSYTEGRNLMVSLLQSVMFSISNNAAVGILHIEPSELEPVGWLDTVPVIVYSVMYINQIFCSVVLD